MRPPRTVVYQDKAGEWRWKRVAGNGRIIASSGESFTRMADAERAASRAFMGPDEVEQLEAGEGDDG